LLMVYAFQLTVLAPVSEELLFRGWLWTALRRSWGAWSTGFVTGIGWWLLHAGFGSNAIFRLLPSVVILSLVRENTGSVRASVILHVLSNMRMVIVSLIALSFSL
jgi:membrane protease YdiL (CAAX protease family)